MRRSSISASLRRRVAQTFQFRCAYCQTAARIIGPLLEIDHIEPEAAGGTSDEDNLCLFCPLCNSRKSDRREAADPESGELCALFHPRTQIWSEHFVWANGGAVIRGKTPIGRATVALLDMNAPDIAAARRLWTSVGWHPPSQ